MTPWTKIEALEQRIKVLEDGRVLRLVAWASAMLILTAVAGLSIYLVITREQKQQKADYVNCLARRNIIAELHVAYATQINVKPSSISDPNLRLLIKVANKNQKQGYTRVKKNQKIVRCKPVLDGHDPVPMTRSQRFRFLVRYLANRINPDAKEGVPEVLPRLHAGAPSKGGGLIQTPNQGGQLRGPTGPKGPEGPPGEQGQPGTPTPPTTPPPEDRGPVGNTVCGLLPILCEN